MKIVQRLIAAFIILISFYTPVLATYPTPNAEKKYDVFGIGTATVDIITRVSEEEFKRLLVVPYNVKKGEMIYIDEKTANNLQSRMKNRSIIAGDSAANVMVDIASLGGKSAFNTIVADDELGQMFNRSLQNYDVVAINEPKTDNYKTARNLIFVTPDGERTMLTYSGIAEEFGQVDIKYHKIKDYKVVYVEGGIWDNDGKKSKATLRAFNAAKRVGALKAFALHDSLFVNKYREQFLKIIQDVDLIFCNEKEAMSLFNVANHEESIAEFQKLGKVSIMTASDKGAYLIYNNEVVHIPPKVKPEKVVDTTGAGDAFTAGFIYGYINGMSLEESGEIGAQAAAYIIQQIGARPKEKLSKIVKVKFASTQN
jgi:sugar/nucleoside kinase (ribokinase family)